MSISVQPQPTVTTTSAISAVPTTNTNSRGRSTKSITYTSTKVTGPSGNPPTYSTEIIKYSDAKGSNPTVIGTRDAKGVTNWNSNATKSNKQNAAKINAASTNQVNSMAGSLATTAEQKEALNASTGNGNKAIGDGDNVLRPVGGQGGKKSRYSSGVAGSNKGSDIGSTTGSTATDPFASGKDAKGTKNSFPQNLVFPRTLRKSGQDTLVINMMKYEPKKLQSGEGQLGFSDRSGMRNSIGRVILPVPGGIQDSNQVSWSSGSMNAMQIGMAQIAMNTVLKGFNKGAETTAKIGEAVLKNKDDVKKALGAAVAGAAGGDTAAIQQRTTGQVMNPNMELLFGGPSLRNFSFGFKLSARDQQEADMILKIIRFFKQGMAAIRTESNLFLKSPHTFRLSYKHNGQNHRGLNKFKECALTSFGVQYTPDGNYSTYRDGIMTAYQIQMAFQELEPVYNDDYGTSFPAEVGF